MVAGRQDAVRELPYLVDACLNASGKPMRHGTTLLQEDLVRVERLRAAHSTGKSKTGSNQSGRHLPQAREEFLRLLHDHATGFFAPVDLKT
jgi:hypothetical protein